ncbi:MAG: 5'/3'-nucleotidase SurE [Alphaproteobacteria bacterium]|nr:5'/3'-nucleotidase SurE [Alphaproteobacteria bacterium]
MRILISNDDGITAPGLRVLERVARDLAKEVWVVAPETEQSGASHSLTLHAPVRLRRIGPRRFAVGGTPTDCVLIAVNRLMAEARPDLVLSGVNRGGNLADDVTYSGTIAAAMEATLLGVPAIALSQTVRDDEAVHWSTAEQVGPDLIRKLFRHGWPRDVLINVNFPDVAPDQVSGVRLTVMGRRKVGDLLPERIDPRGRPYYWIGAMRTDEISRADTDLAAIRARAVSVTPIGMDMTHRATRRNLQRLFD